MSVLNPLAREISAKIVYYGPGLSGKTTTLHAIYAAVRPERRGELVSLATETDRTIFFDFLPLHVERVQGLGVRFQLYTVPGQVFYGATRRLVLSGADGVVFVADSQAHCRDSNLESFESLRNNIADLGIEIDDFPLVMQYNKRDLPDALPMAEMSALLNFLGAPEFTSCATTGEGVLPVLKAITKLVIRSLTEQQPAVRRQIVDGDERESREPQGGIVDTVYAMSQSMAEQNDLVQASAAQSLGAVALASPALAVPSVAPLPSTVESRANGTTVRPEPLGLSFARLWPKERVQAVQEIENAIACAEYATAVQSASALLAELIDSLPGLHRGADPGTKASLLGLDGTLYLRVCRLATMPREALQEADALLALHVLIAARLKVQSI